MAGFHLSEQIKSTPSDTFEFIAELDNIPKWISIVTGVEKQTEGPTTVGTRFTETRLIRGMEGNVDNEVRAYEPPKTFATGFTGRGFDVTYTYRFAAEGSGTRADLDVDVKGSGLTALFVFVIARSMKGQDRDILKRLKSAIEASREE